MQSYLGLSETKLSDQVVFHSNDRKLNYITNTIGEGTYFGSFVFFRVKSHAFIGVPCKINYYLDREMRDTLSWLSVRGDYSVMIIFEVRTFDDASLSLSDGKNVFRYYMSQNPYDNRTQFSDINKNLVSYKRIWNPTSTDDRFVVHEEGVTRDLTTMSDCDRENFLRAFVIPVLFTVRDIPNQKEIQPVRLINVLSIRETLESIMKGDKMVKFNQFNQYLITEYEHMLNELCIEIKWANIRYDDAKRLAMNIESYVNSCLHIVRSYNKVLRDNRDIRPGGQIVR